MLSRITDPSDVLEGCLERPTSTLFDYEPWMFDRMVDKEAEKNAGSVDIAPSSYRLFLLDIVRRKMRNNEIDELLIVTASVSNSKVVEREILESYNASPSLADDGLPEDRCRIIVVSLDNAKMMVDSFLNKKRANPQYNAVIWIRSPVLNTDEAVYRLLLESYRVIQYPFRLTSRSFHVIYDIKFKHCLEFEYEDSTQPVNIGDATKLFEGYTAVMDPLRDELELLRGSERTRFSNDT